MAHAAQDSELVGYLGKLGQVLAKAYARHVGLNFLKLTAVRIRCVRLEIKGVHVGGAATKTHEDRRLRLGIGINPTLVSTSQKLGKA